MSRNRMFFVFVALALLVTGGFTYNAAIDTAGVTAQVRAATNWIEANQSALNPADASLGTAPQSSPDPYMSPDNFIVVPNEQPAVGTTGADFSDYYLRHPSTIDANNVGGSDWFQRHPESMNPDNAIDQSDYGLRHPGSITVNTDGASDWFQRHPESLNPDNAIKQDDECTLVYPNPCQ